MIYSLGRQKYMTSYFITEMHDNCVSKEAHKAVKVWIEKRLQTKLHPWCFI